MYLYSAQNHNRDALSNPHQVSRSCDYLFLSYEVWYSPLVTKRDPDLSIHFPTYGSMIMINPGIHQSGVPCDVSACSKSHDLSVGFTSSYTFGIPYCNLRLHYITFMGIWWRLRPKTPDKTSVHFELWRCCVRRWKFCYGKERSW